MANRDQRGLNSFPCCRLGARAQIGALEPSSSGEVLASIEEMAQHAAAFTEALSIKKLDALGFSMGGFIAQQFTIDRPDLVRKLILVGTGPRSGEGMASLTPEAQEIFGAQYDAPDELWLRVFFTPPKQSQAAGRKYLERLYSV